MTKEQFTKKCTQLLKIQKELHEDGMRMTILLGGVKGAHALHEYNIVQDENGYYQEVNNYFHIMLETPVPMAKIEDPSVVSAPF